MGVFGAGCLGRFMARFIGGGVDCVVRPLQGRWWCGVDFDPRVSPAAFHIEPLQGSRKTGTNRGHR